MLVSLWKGIYLLTSHAGASWVKCISKKAVPLGLPLVYIFEKFCKSLLLPLICEVIKVYCYKDK